MPVYPTEPLLSTEPRGDPPDPAQPCCPGCGSRLRFRGQREFLSIWEYERGDCPVTLTEVLDPDAPPARRGGHRV